jgi:PAS domain S-box-containing protein
MSKWNYFNSILVFHFIGFNIIKIQNMKPLDIIIVEDEKIIATDICECLTSVGHHVIYQTSNGEDCIRNIHRFQPQLIVMDIKLSGKLNGIKTAEAISELIKVPIVFLTAFSDADTLNQIKRNGEYGFVIKPFQNYELLTEIDLTHNRFIQTFELQKQRDYSHSALQETETFFRQIVNNVSDGIYRIDLNGNFTYVNPIVVLQTGYPEKDLLRMQYADLVRYDYRQSIYFFFKNILEDEINDSYLEFPIITSNGDEKWIGQKVHLIKIRNQVVGFQVIARDITHEREFKEQLIIAKSNAEKTAETKSRFLANISHEIRTPLNGIVGVINLLNQTNLSEKQKTYLNAITSSSNQLMGIINDVLDLAKIDADKLELDCTDFNIEDLFQAVVAVFEMKCIEKQINLEWFIDDRIPKFLNGDPVRLNQIIYNLLGNSIKFTEKGGILLQVELLNISKRDINVLIRISDTGIGMDEQALNKVFDAFTQAEDQMSRKFGGTGLGLTIVKKIVEIHGGKISVKSQPQQGTSFELNLPFKRCKSTPSIPDLSEPILVGDIENLKILLVEDNKVNQMVTKDNLEAYKVVVTIAENGKEALELLENQIFDLILMDMQMPILDGYQTMREIRNSKDLILKQIPIIALTANAIDAEITKCFDCGADDYLSKPFKPSVLIDKIYTFCSISQALSLCLKSKTAAINKETFEFYLNGRTSIFGLTLKELKNSFVADWNEMKSAILKRDKSAMKMIAHRVKPNLSILGLNDMADIGDSIEEMENLNEIKDALSYLMVNLPLINNQLDELYEKYELMNRD